MKFRGNYYFLSNMYPCKIEYKGHTYKCVESAFQAQKVVGTVDENKIAEFEKLDGFGAKKLGRNVVLRNDWEQVKNQIMQDILEIKFSDEDLKTWLTDVKGEIVEDNTWGDTYWGKYDGKGENHLGIILMNIRAKYV